MDFKHVVIDQTKVLKMAIDILLDIKLRHFKVRMVEGSFHVISSKHALCAINAPRYLCLSLFLPVLVPVPVLAHLIQQCVMLQATLMILSSFILLIYFHNSTSANHNKTQKIVKRVHSVWDVLYLPAMGNVIRIPVTSRHRQSLSSSRTNLHNLCQNNCLTCSWWAS